jgi:opacity protein-like surface antigen
MMRSVLTLVFVCTAVSAYAQDTRASVSGTVSAANMASHTDPSFAAAFGYRFTDVVGLELEATVVPTLGAPFPGATIQGSLLGAASPVPIAQIFPTPTFSNPGGRAVIFSNNVRVHIPTTAARIVPYFVAGGGVANIRRTADFNFPTPILPVPLEAIGLTPLRFTTSTQHVSASASQLALTIGGGLGVRAASRLWIDADLRMFRLMGDTDQNLGRFGVGARYTF